MRHNRSVTVFLVVLVALLTFSSVVYAFTVVVDGTREAAWDTGGTVADADEAGITNQGVDINRVQWTNDATDFFFLIETVGSTDWNQVPQAPFVWICINSDNNVGTGSDHPGVCLDSGYDRYILIEGPTPLTVTVMNDSFSPVVATTDVATSGEFTEVSVDLAALRMSSTNCLSTIPTGVFMDGGTADPDDNVADAGDFTMSCGSPTAVTLQQTGTTGQSAALPIAIGAVALVVAVSAGVVFSRKKQII